ncbi:hypothetical protein [Methylobacterium persicinum]|uniref:Transmembrane protein n=1 Tax=Methylobacterium persicinum TaxID=374426 RepID=A0ABU0HNW8_9HYPH|nr:hypothetical protein [Methylobacterium persicinum]MDQ0444019.1 hypothetical protein [Methylobacterium persicinum]GJE38432.1 hypothetical protein KHHGKMAE_2504 [Methylobacterium persicinum]
MRKFAIIAAAATMAVGSIAATTGAEARPYGFHGGYGGYGHHGYYGGRRGIGTGAAVGLGIAGLAAGAIAAGAARDAYGYGAPAYGYGYAAPAYGYGAPGYYGYGY